MLINSMRLEINMAKVEKRYQEGECESCGSYAQLYDVDGKLICEECKDEEGAITEKDAENETESD